MHRMPWALVLAFASAGNSRPARIAMMAMTTSNSMSVNPRYPRPIHRLDEVGNGWRIGCPVKSFRIKYHYSRFLQIQAGFPGRAPGPIQERSADSLVRVFFWHPFQFARTRLSALLYPPFLHPPFLEPTLAVRASLAHDFARSPRTNSRLVFMSLLTSPEGVAVSNWAQPLNPVWTMAPMTFGKSIFPWPSRFGLSFK